MLNNVTTLTYFPTGPVNTIMGQQNNVTTYTYDSFGRLTASSGSITNPFRPEEAGYFVPPQPTTWMEPLRGRAKIRHSSDLFVAQDGLIYLTDYDAGLYILQWKGT